MDVIVGEDEFARQIAAELKAKFIKINRETFPDSEIKPTLETEEGIEGNNILIVSRTNRLEPSINNEIMKIFFTASTLDELGASQISLFLPYMFYARQDKQFLPGEPKSLLNIAELYEKMKIKNIFTINSHLYGKEDGSLQDFFKNTKVHDLSPARLFSEYLSTKNLSNPIVIGPDKGTRKMAKELSELISADFECLEKTRNHNTGEITIKSPLIELKDKDVIIYDDVSASGGTVARTFNFVSELRPSRVFLVLPHVITRKGVERLSKLGCSELITTGSFITKDNKFTELSLVTLFSEYVKEI